MSSVNLTNFTIEERTTLKGDTYFLIKDIDQNEAYFCFQDKLKENWNELVNNWQKIKEVELEYQEQSNYKHVISFCSLQEGEFLI